MVLLLDIKQWLLLQLLLPDEVHQQVIAAFAHVMHKLGS